MRNRLKVIRCPEVLLADRVAAVQHMVDFCKSELRKALSLPIESPVVDDDHIDSIRESYQQMFEQIGSNEADWDIHVEKDPVDANTINVEINLRLPWWQNLSLSQSTEG